MDGPHTIDLQGIHKGHPKNMRDLLALAPPDVQVFVDFVVETLGREWDRVIDRRRGEGENQSGWLAIDWIIGLAERHQHFRVFLWKSKFLTEPSGEWEVQTWRTNEVSSQSGSHIMEKKDPAKYLRFLVSETRGHWCDLCDDGIARGTTHCDNCMPDGPEIFDEETILDLFENPPST